MVALMLQAQPGLTPDQVKCKLMDAARPAVKSDGSLAYSVFQQGAGRVDAYDAVHGTVFDCANRGIDVNLDLAGIHFGGRANRDENGNYYLMGLDGYLWNNGYLWSNSLTETMSINVWVEEQLAPPDSSGGSGSSDGGSGTDSGSGGGKGR